MIRLTLNDRILSVLGRDGQIQDIGRCMIIARKSQRRNNQFKDLHLLLITPFPLNPVPIPSPLLPRQQNPATQCHSSVHHCLRAGSPVGRVENNAAVADDSGAV